MNQAIGLAIYVLDWYKCTDLHFDPWGAGPAVVEEHEPWGCDMEKDMVISRDLSSVE